MPGEDVGDDVPRPQLEAEVEVVGAGDQQERSSLGLGTLIVLRRRARAIGCDLTLAAVSTQVARLMQRTGTDVVIPVEPAGSDRPTFSTPEPA